MNSRAKLYILSVVGVACTVLLRALLVRGFQLHFASVTPLMWFVVVGLLAEAAAVDFKLGPAPQAKSSIAFIPFLASAVLFSPIAAATSAAAVIAVAQFALRRQTLLKGAFNVGQGFLAVYAGSAIFARISGAPNSAMWFIAFFGLATVFFATNILLSSFAIAAISEERPLPVIAKVVGPGGSNLWYDFLSSPIALVPAGLYDEIGAGGLLIIVLPLLVMRSSYLSKLDLQAANRDLLDVLIKAIETRDPYTSGHSRRVSTLATWIAEELGLPRRQVAEVQNAALLHDIGKIDAAFSRVIAKPSDLLPQERLLIESHADKGADLLMSLSSMSSSVVAAVRHHHERWDGGGYPAGKSAAEIPLASRIIMISDSIDAMLSDRPYRKALDLPVVIRELRRCSGSQFDPAIAEAVCTSNILHRAVELVAKGRHEAVSEPSLLASA